MKKKQSRPGAPVGNQNAKGGRLAGGASTFLFGPVGSFGATAFTGLKKKDPKALARATRWSTGMGAAMGAVGGTMTMPIVGTAIGAAVGAGMNYGASKLGKWAGSDRPKAIKKVKKK